MDCMWSVEGNRSIPSKHCLITVYTRI
ncbi:hypothetical protein RSAG8_03366, partial [Rhizoctonia solani AG-8 WAC10335]